MTLAQDLCEGSHPVGFGGCTPSYCPCPCHAPTQRVIQEAIAKLAEAVATLVCRHGRYGDCQACWAARPRIP